MLSLNKDDFCLKENWSNPRATRFTFVKGHRRRRCTIVTDTMQQWFQKRGFRDKDRLVEQRETCLLHTRERAGFAFQKHSQARTGLAAQNASLSL